MNNSHLIKNPIPRSTLVFVLIGLFLSAILPLATGAVISTPPSFAATQQVALSFINTAVNKLNTAEIVIQNNISLSASTKTSILNDLNGIETQLLMSKTAVEQATTNAELQATYSQVIQYLKANKDVIKNDFTLAITEIGMSASAKAKAYEEQILKLLKILEVTCQAQASTIATLTQQITQLESDVATLNSAIKAKDATIIKAKMQEMNTLIKSMSNNVKIIKVSCNIPSI